MGKDITRYRTVLKDGTLNISLKSGVSFKDLYHDLLKLTWPRFLFGFTIVFFLIHAVFGLIYFWLPLSEFDGFQHTSGLPHYLDCVFFSVQTFGTIGYGRVSPVGVPSNLVVTLESLMSLIMVAVMTGLIFSRFARPEAKVIFSHHAVIRKFDGIPSLMFRLANARKNYVSDAHVNVSLAMDDPKTRYRIFTDLKLERDTTPIFALSWTIAHDIDDASPLKGLNRDELCRRNAEIVVTFSGTDTTLSQSVYAKSSYVTEEILENHDFVDVLERKKDGSMELLLENFHKVVSYQES